MNEKNSRSKDFDELVDIRTIKVDKSLPKEERIIEYVRQIKNPYRYKCGKFTVTAQFSQDGLTMEECLYGIIL